MINYFKKITTLALRNKIRLTLREVRFRYCIKMNCDISVKFRRRVYPSFMERDCNEGIQIFHPHSIFITREAVIGNNCTLYGNNTIGFAGKGAPKLGDNITLGVGAVVIGDITIGNNVKIGANATVTKSVPAHCTIVGDNKII